MDDSSENLRACSRGASREGVALKTSSSHRPVVLAVEDEPLILMLAVDMIAEAGFEPVLGYERRPSDRHPGESRRYRRDIHRHQHAGVHGRSEIGAGGATTVASDQDNCHFRFGCR